MLDNTKAPALGPPYSLLEPLPSDVVGRPAGSLGDYRMYPVFSLPWLKRRAAIFVPGAVVIGVVQAVFVGAAFNDWRLALLCAAVGAPIWTVIVSAAPALATFVRHRHLPLHHERVAVVAAIVIGIGISFAAQYLANQFSQATVTPYYRAAMGEAAFRQMRPTLLLIIFVLTWQFVLFFTLGGGFALRTYFSEQQRWRDAQRLRSMEGLRQEKSEADLKFAVLQAQVEPHFLFNTLASVHSLIRQDPQRAEATVEALVDHLRATMPKLRAGSAKRIRHWQSRSKSARAI